jgi:hypothetical protein
MLGYHDHRSPREERRIVARQQGLTQKHRDNCRQQFCVRRSSRRLCLRQWLAPNTNVSSRTTYVAVRTGYVWLQSSGRFDKARQESVRCRRHQRRCRPEHVFNATRQMQVRLVEIPIETVVVERYAKN